MTPSVAKEVAMEVLLSLGGIAYGLLDNSVAVAVDKRESVT
jgi:hypothetical protein